VESSSYRGQDPSANQKGEGVGGSNPRPPTRKDKKSGSELNTSFLIFFCTQPGIGTVGVEDHIIHRPFPISAVQCVNARMGQAGPCDQISCRCLRRN
jgi:hypothetical protein